MTEKVEFLMAHDRPF